MTVFLKTLNRLLMSLGFFCPDVLKKKCFLGRIRFYLLAL
jgi:hypothetical protein